jgi:hypothetical protein
MTAWGAMIQVSKSEAANFANLAIWLIQPSKTCVTNVFHALAWAIPGEDEKVARIQSIDTGVPLYCHPNDLTRQVYKDQVEAAGRLCTILASIPPTAPCGRLFAIFGQL